MRWRTRTMTNGATGASLEIAVKATIAGRREIATEIDGKATGAKTAVPNFCYSVEANVQFRKAKRPDTR